MHGLFSSCAEEGLLIVVVHRLLTAVDALLQSTGSRACALQHWRHRGSVAAAPGLQSSGSVAVHGLGCPTACGTSPDQGLEPVSAALAGGFFTTQPPGNPRSDFICKNRPNPGMLIQQGN